MWNRSRFLRVSLSVDELVVVGVQKSYISRELVKPAPFFSNIPNALCTSGCVAHITIVSLPYFPLRAGGIAGTRFPR